MRLVKIFLLGLLIVGMSFIPIANRSVNAQFVDPEEFFEDNPARFDEAIEEGKIIVPDISALGMQGQVGQPLMPNATVR